LIDEDLPLIPATPMSESGCAAELGTGEPAQIERDRRILRAALLNHAFRPGEGWRKNGRPFGWMLDCREVLLATAVLPAVSRLMYRLIADWHPRAVVGTGLSGAPLVAAIALESARNAEPIDGLLLRDRPKGYGRRRQLEGPIPPPGSRVVFVDDLVSSGATARWAAKTLAQHSLQPVGVATLMTFEGAATTPLTPDDLPRRALFTLADLGIVAADNDAAAAEVLWRLHGLNHDDDIPYSRPTRCGELVVAGSNRGEVLAVDLSGTLKWRVALGRTEAPAPTHCSPLSAPHGIVIGTDDGVLRCLDPDTGRYHWSARCGDRIGSGLVGDENGHVFIAATDLPRSGALVCVDVASGTVQWRRPLTGYAHARPGLAADGPTVVAADNAGMISAFAADGTLRWRHGLGAAVKADLTLDDRGTCFCVDFDGFLTALDLADGRVLWRRKLARCLYSTPLVTMTGVIVGGDEQAFCLERRSGEVTWVAPVGPRVRGAVSRLADGTLAFGCSDGTVRFVSDTGLNRGLFRTGGAVMSGATSLDDRSILVSSADGYVYALRSPHPS
jgi:outer membrane protein assembly factor BamB/orotate phosphoribosyltransferase